MNANNGNGIDIVKLIAIIVAIPAALIAVFTVVKLTRDRNQTDAKIHEMLRMAELYQRVDNFGGALEELDKALVLRTDQELQVRRTELETFQIAAQYDQTNVLQDKGVLSDLQKKCDRLLSEARSARVLALCGIVEDLHDRPTGATKKYDEAAHNDPAYPNVYNYWGYTTLKWTLGGTNWSADALEKFSQAIMKAPDYPWPYVNRAVVYLRGDDPDHAEGDLETAQKLLPQNPRVYLLWGQYHWQKADRLRAQRLPEFRQQLDDAVRSFEDAREKNPAIADVRLALGISYEKVGRLDDAVHEYEEATKLDRSSVQACINFARLLTIRGEKARGQKEVQRCQKVNSAARSDFENRLRETTDTAAREWLSQQIAEPASKADERGGFKRKL